MLNDVKNRTEREKHLFHEFQTADEVKKICLDDLDFAKLQESFGTQKVIGGKGDLYAFLMVKEKGDRNLVSSMEGTFSLWGDDLVIYTMDLDKVLSSYETSKK